MKVTIELNTADQADMDALRRLVGGETQLVVRTNDFKLSDIAKDIAKPLGVSVSGSVKPKVEPPKKKAAPKPAPKPQAPPVDAKAVAARGKAMTEANEKLGTVVGDQAKMTRVEKARLAAKARWAKQKKVGQVQPVKTPAPKPVKPKAGPRKPPIKAPKPQDFSNADEQRADQFPEVEGMEMRLPGMESKNSLYPDGRELLEGTFKVPKEEENHEREVADIARELGGLPGGEDGE